MPSVDSTVSANYLKATAPFAKFGTRDLVFIAIKSDAVNFATTPTISNSNLSKLIRAVQQIGEIYYVGAPDATDGVTFILSKDTYVDSTDNNSQTIAEAVTAGGISGSITVTTYSKIAGVTLTA